MDGKKMTEMPKVEKKLMKEKGSAIIRKAIFLSEHLAQISHIKNVENHILAKITKLRITFYETSLGEIHKQIKDIEICLFKNVSKIDKELGE